MSNDVSIELIRAIVENLRRADDEWESLAMVIELSDGRVSGTYGYTYGPADRVGATSARPSTIEQEATAYLNGYFKAGEPWPVKLLVQFDRTKREYEIVFEDTDASRWNVSPSNLDEIRQELRPKFG
ncbi:hypothetical protein LG322_02200 [Microbacterium aerolatum]|uniref:hypothetical protein n=1 Tax=Microbacterium aerolatum TaxID=153731 RepID=UPI0038514F29